MNMTKKTLFTCAKMINFDLNYSNRREVELFDASLAFFSRRQSKSAKVAFGAELIKKRGVNARTILTVTSQSRSRYAVRRMKELNEIKCADTLFKLAEKFRMMKIYELSNAYYARATKLKKKTADFI